MDGSIFASGIAWQNICRVHLILLQTKYISTGPHGFKVLPILCLWKLFVAMATRVQIQSAQNLNVALSCT